MTVKVDTKKEKIYKVAYDQAHYMLVEWKFPCAGRMMEVYTERELRGMTRVTSAHINPDEQLADSHTINRTIAQMTEIIAAENEFELVNIKDAKYIYYIIDHFIHSQYERHFRQTDNVRFEMLKDFHHLGKLADKMLEWMDLEDAINMPNVKKREEKFNEETGIDKAFAAAFLSTAKTNTEVGVISEQTVAELIEPTQRRYDNPFDGAISRSLDRIRAERWSFKGDS